MNPVTLQFYGRHFDDHSDVSSDISMSLPYIYFSSVFFLWYPCTQLFRQKLLERQIHLFMVISLLIMYCHWERQVLVLCIWFALSASSFHSYPSCHSGTVCCISSCLFLVFDFLSRHSRVCRAYAVTTIFGIPRGSCYPKEPHVVMWFSLLGLVSSSFFFYNYIRFQWFQNVI